MHWLRKTEKSLLTQICNFPGTPEEALSWTSSQILWELRGLRVLAKRTTVLHLSPSSFFFLSSSPPSSRTSPQQSPSFKAPAVEKLDEKNSLIGSTTRSLQRYQPHQGNSFLPPFFSFLSVPPTSNLWSTCDQSTWDIKRSNCRQDGHHQQRRSALDGNGQHDLHGQQQGSVLDGSRLPGSTWATSAPAIRGLIRSGLIFIIITMALAIPS